MKKTLFIISAALASVMVFASCSAGPEAGGSATPAETAATESAAQTSASASPSAEETSAAPVQSEPETVRAEGIYQGQADNNFIEIKIAVEPEETAYKVFMLTGEIKDGFEALGLDTGDTVSLSYYENEVGQLVLTELSKQ